MIKLTISKLTLASSLIADVDSTLLDNNECDFIQQIAVACTYHVTLVSNLVEQANRKELESLARYRIPLSAAITFANDVIETLSKRKQSLETKHG
jgi:hypothetical protein